MTRPRLQIIQSSLFSRDNDGKLWTTTTSSSSGKIRVLPGSTLSLPTGPPPPPSHPPPQPVHLYKIAVIGDALSGKSSSVDKFLIRKSAAARRTTSATSGSNYAGRADNDNNSLNGGGGIHWCNASATSQGTFGTVQSTTTTTLVQLIILLPPLH